MLKVKKIATWLKCKMGKDALKRIFLGEKKVMQCTTWPAEAVVYGPGHVAHERDQYTGGRDLGGGQRVYQMKVYPGHLILTNIHQIGSRQLPPIQI